MRMKSRSALNVVVKWRLVISRMPHIGGEGEAFGVLDGMGESLDTNARIVVT